VKLLTWVLCVWPFSHIGSRVHQVSCQPFQDGEQCTIKWNKGLPADVDLVAIRDDWNKSVWHVEKGTKTYVVSSVGPHRVIQVNYRGKHTKGQ
jgi:hypothetical protein